MPACRRSPAAQLSPDRQKAKTRKAGAGQKFSFEAGRDSYFSDCVQVPDRTEPEVGTMALRAEGML